MTIIWPTACTNIMKSLSSCKPLHYAYLQYFNHFINWFGSKTTRVQWEIFPFCSFNRSVCVRLSHCRRSVWKQWEVFRCFRACRTSQSRTLKWLEKYFWNKSCRQELWQSGPRHISRDIMFNASDSRCGLKLQRTESSNADFTSALLYTKLHELILFWNAGLKVQKTNTWMCLSLILTTYSNTSVRVSLVWMMSWSRTMFACFRPFRRDAEEEKNTKRLNITSVSFFWRRYFEECC